MFEDAHIQIEDGRLQIEDAHLHIEDARFLTEDIQIKELPHYSSDIEDAHIYIMELRTHYSSQTLRTHTSILWN